MLGFSCSEGHPGAPPYYSLILSCSSVFVVFVGLRSLFLFFFFLCAIFVDNGVGRDEEY